MAKPRVDKVLTVKDTGHGFTNGRMCDRKLSLTLNWINARFKTLDGTSRLGTNSCEQTVRFYFLDAAEATWFELMFEDKMIEV